MSLNSNMLGPALNTVLEGLTLEVRAYSWGASMRERALLLRML